MDSLHVGKFITAIIARKRIKKKDFAAAMNYSPTNIQALLNREDWHLKRIQQAEEVLDEKILVHFVKLSDGKASNSMVMEDSPAYIIGKQSEKLKQCEKERAEGKELLELVMEQNRFLKEKLKQHEI